MIPTEFQKSQNVRLIDIFLLGSFMIYAGTKLPTRPLQIAMVISGILTISYNYNNFRRNL